MPKDTISETEAQAAATSAVRDASADDSAIRARAQVESVGLVKRGAESIAAERDRAKAAEDAEEMAAYQAEQQAAKMARESTRAMDVGPGQVRVKITALGHGKVFTGEDEGPDGERFPTYHRGAEPPMTLSVARTLMARGYADSVE